MPVTLRLLSRETFPSNLMPGVDAGKVIVSGTMVLLLQVGCADRKMIALERGT
jgi:hypothetical protein